MRLVILFLLSLAVPGFCQRATCDFPHPGECVKDVINDQAGIWTSPLHVKPSDAAWLVPLAASTALAFHFDTPAENALGHDQTLTNRSLKIARFGSPYVTAGSGGALYVIGLTTHNQHLAETGRLSVEAIVDVSLVAGALKLATDRQRVENNESAFWPGGTRSYALNSSFPSGHSAASWAMAEVIASEYHNHKAVQIAAYAFAAAISVTRITGQAHFPSDVVVGSAMGYFVGRYVTHHHAKRG